MELKYSEWTENPLWLEGAEWTKVDGFKWRQPNGGHKKNEWKTRKDGAGGVECFESLRSFLELKTVELLF